MLDELVLAVTLDCPYCGESFESSVDLSAGGQSYVEDCWVCCRPLVVQFSVGVDGSLQQLDVSRDD